MARSVRSLRAVFVSESLSAINRKRHHFAKAIGSGGYHHQSIESQCDAYAAWQSVLHGFEQSAITAQGKLSIGLAEEVRPLISLSQDAGIEQLVIAVG